MTHANRRGGVRVVPRIWSSISITVVDFEVNSTRRHWKDRILGFYYGLEGIHEYANISWKQVEIKLIWEDYKENRVKRERR